MTEMSKPAPVLALFSDFGGHGPYCGQVLAQWAGLAPNIPSVNLYAESPAFDIAAGAHLLYAYTRQLPPGSVIEAVVDPGVGGDRDVCAVWADGLWFCGPDNGLLSVTTARADDARMWRVSWKPDAEISMTFHGRDLFAPLAAYIALHGCPPEPSLRVGRTGWHAGVAVSDPLYKVITVDPFGNLITGIHGDDVDYSARLLIAGKTLHYAERFDQVPVGTLFWYINSNGLVEVAANQASAASLCECGYGTPIVLEV